MNKKTLNKKQTDADIKAFMKKYGFEALVLSAMNVNGEGVAIAKGKNGHLVQLTVELEKSVIEECGPMAQFLFMLERPSMPDMTELFGVERKKVAKKK